MVQAKTIHPYKDLDHENQRQRRGQDWLPALRVGEVVTPDAVNTARLEPLKNKGSSC